MAARHGRLLPCDYFSLKPGSRALSTVKTETAYSEDVISIATHLFTICEPKAT